MKPSIFFALTLSGLAACSGDIRNIVPPTTIGETPPPVEDPPGGPIEDTLPSATPLRAGHYVGQRCFLNKSASEGFGAPVYTMAEMRFDEKGIGTNDFKLYLDEDCSDPPALEGSVNLVITYEKSLGNVLVFKFVQEDPAVEDDEPQTFFITGVRDGNDYMLDVDFADGESGPYFTMPTEGEVQAFGNSPLSQGVRFKAQP